MMRIILFYLYFLPVLSLAETPVLTIYAPDYFVSEWGPGPKIEQEFEKKCNFHEGNAVMGKANRLFWKYIKVRTSAFNLKEHYHDTIQVGMPIRSQLLELKKNKSVKPRRI